MNDTMTRPVRLILATAGILLGLGLALLAREHYGRSASPSARPPVPPVTPGMPPSLPPIDEKAVRAQAWERITPLLDEAERAGATALDRHLATIPAFLEERQQGTRPFAARLLSLQGKWELVKSRFRAQGGEEYAQMLQEQFAQHVFRTEELEQAVEAAAHAYVSELQGIENQLFIRLRADLADGDLPAATVIPQLQSETVLRQHFDTLVGQMLPLLDQDLQLTVGREVVSLVASELATAITLRVGTAVGARLGVSVGILSAGTASGWTTFGIGLVVAIIVDQVIDQIIRAAGYDAEQRVADRVNETLDAIGRTITEGDPEARAALDELQRLQRDDPDETVRAACARAASSIQRGCRLHGLRGELSKLNTARAALRKAALDRLIRNQETTP